MKLFITFTIWFYYTLYRIVMCVVGLIHRMVLGPLPRFSESRSEGEYFR